MDGYKKIIKLIIFGSVLLLFHACRVEKSLGVYLFQPTQVDSDSTVLMHGTVQTDSISTVLTPGTVKADSVSTVHITDTARADQPLTQKLTSPLIDSTGSETGSPGGRPVAGAGEIQFADTIIYSESEQAKDSIVNETIVSKIDTTETGAVEIATPEGKENTTQKGQETTTPEVEEITTSEAKEITTSVSEEITPSMGREIIAGQDTIVRLLKTLISTMDSLRQAELRSGLASLEWIGGWDDLEMQDLPDSSFFTVGLDPTAGAIVSDSLPSTASDSLPSTVPDSLSFAARSNLLSAAPDSLASIARNDLPSAASDSLPSTAPDRQVTRGPTPGEQVIPTREVNASILTLTRGLETSLKTIQQQGQENSELLKKMESEMKLLKKEINEQSVVRVNESANNEYSGNAQGLYPATELQENTRNNQEMAGDTTDMTSQVRETFNIQTTGSNKPPPHSDSLTDPVALVTLQLKHYEEVKNLRDSIQQREKENTDLKQQLNRLQAEHVNATRDTVANAVYLKRMDALRSDYERILERKTDSIYLLEEEIIGMVGDVGNQRKVVSFVVYYESSSLTGNNMEEFESKLDLLALSEVNTVYLSAFSDASGTEDANYYISAQRLDVLTDKLIGKGIDPLKIFRQNHGEKFASPGTESLDRRVEIIFRF